MAVFNSERTFGVEIEVTTRRHAETIARQINAVFHNRGINQSCEAQRYNHNTQPIWKIVPDGSVRGWEIVSPPMKGLEAKAQISAVCKALVDLDCRVDRTTGLHVHHDANNLSGQAIGSAFALYATNHDVIDMMLAPSRRSAGFARRFSVQHLLEGGYNFAGHRVTDGFKNNTWGEARDKVSSNLRSRYFSMNVQAMYDHGTIEFRQHQGTLDAEKIWNWILFTQAIIEASTEAKQFPKASKIGSKGAFNNLYGKLRVSANYNNGNPDSEIYVKALKFMNKRFQFFCQQAHMNPKTMTVEIR